MDLQIKNIENLLTSVSVYISQNEKIRELKGENFNLFSIMQMETAENKTHSNFIGELLNINGTHRKGNIFLKLFLELFCDNHLDLDSTKVKTEYHIAEVNLENATGGRIDIYLRDKFNKIICIENKIYAIDQVKQIERYYNFNTANNKVLYLTLLGTEPSEQSKGKLNSIEHFKKISYQKDILNWLQLCIKESSEQPILRESIKQYIVLIKKLTNTMDNQFNLAIKKLMISNFEATKYIRDNANSFLDEIKGNFRMAILESLKTKLDASFEISLGDNVSNVYSQIWIKYRNAMDRPLIFGIESFSGNIGSHKQGILFIGVFNQLSNLHVIDLKLDEIKNLSKQWIHCEELMIDNSNISLTDEKFLSQIVDDKSEQFKRIVEVVSNQCIKFINSNSESVIKENSNVDVQNQSI